MRGHTSLPPVKATEKAIVVSVLVRFLSCPFLTQHTVFCGTRRLSSVGPQSLPVDWSVYVFDDLSRILGTSRTIS